MRHTIRNRTCPNTDCRLHGQKDAGNIIRHGFIVTKRGRTRRYRCTACGTTRSSSGGTPYFRLQHSRNAFDHVAAMCVEGVSKSSIARIMKISWNTVARWEERAAAAAREFNKCMTLSYELTELQLDEIRSFSGGKTHPMWIFTSIVVWSRLWAATTVGRRTYKNTYQLLADILKSGVILRAPFITTDGFEYYGRAIRELLPGACIHGQVIKQWRKNRVASITRSLRSGMPNQLDAALMNSEDSEIINTSFVERLNLTIRRGCAYLQRKTPCHSRRPERLADQLELLRCYYNFVRPHRALKFGGITRTPAMQAGITSRPWTFRMIFMAAHLAGSVLIWVCVSHRTIRQSSLARAA